MFMFQVSLILGGANKMLPAKKKIYASCQRCGVKYEFALGLNRKELGKREKTCIQVVPNGSDIKLCNGEIKINGK